MVWNFSSVRYLEVRSPVWRHSLFHGLQIDWVVGAGRHLGLGLDGLTGRAGVASDQKDLDTAISLRALGTDAVAEEAANEVEHGLSAGVRG